MKKIVAGIAVLIFGLAGTAFGALDNVGFTANGVELLEGCGGYVLETDGDAATNYFVDFKEGAVSDSAIDPAAGLFLVDIKAQDPASLEQYYTERGVPEPYLSYLIQAANSEAAFANIYAPDTEGLYPVSLLDGAQSELGTPPIPPMVIPGDYPCGTYTVASEDGSIAFTLTIVGSHCGDSDGDCYPDDQDLCLETAGDEPTRRLGVNRWIYNEDGEWEKGPKKGKGKGPAFEPDIWYTYGCSCEQILDAMSEATGGKFKGHYKFGCSKSILEEWNSGVYVLDDGTEIELW